jgi:aspartokinase/homoserine dehydrogenase 1
MSSPLSLLNKVLKFGGSSVASPENIKKVIEVVRQSQAELSSQAQSSAAPLAVVVSAFGGVTDKLIELAVQASNGNEAYLPKLEELKKRHEDAAQELLPKEHYANFLPHLNAQFKDLSETLHGLFLLKELSRQSQDFIMGFGERLSAAIIAEAMQASGLPAAYLDARKLIQTNSEFGDAKVNFELSNQNIREHFENLSAPLQVITGFVASTKEGKSSTLGRGGSDYTAAIFGAALQVQVIEIWTDVSGVLTADPRKVKSAFRIDQMSYQEAMEMSHFGAKVIHPPTMLPALEKNIPINIRNTFEPENQGTFISHSSSSKEFPIKGISSVDKVALIRLEGSGLIGVVGMSSRLFGALARNKVNVMMISQASSEHSICFAVKPKFIEAAFHAIEEEFSLEMKLKQIDPLKAVKNLAILAIVGENMKHHVGLSGKFFSALGEAKVNVVAIAQGSSELNISAVVNQEDEAKALVAVHDAFFQPDLHVYLCGTGLIGGTLLKQLQEVEAPIKVVGLSNSRKMSFNPAGMDLQNWEEAMQNTSQNELTQKANLQEFIKAAQQDAHLNKVFVDCSASAQVSEHYAPLLAAGVSVVTANKKANSASFSAYQTLAQLSRGAGDKARFLYETNVGAGLPVLSTLRSLVSTGDKVTQIEAVLSGTLSYIFNTYDGSVPFSEVVAAAKEKGYTEPDPREDLNGMDVMRKILILARESGLALEAEQVDVQSLVSEECEASSSVEDFFKVLKNMDEDYAKKAKQAAAEGKRLRYIASLEIPAQNHAESAPNNSLASSAVAKVSLQAVGQDHPFYSLSGSDNIVSFQTQRYSNTPLVVKGPGAGAEVTAAGVFADLLRLAPEFSPKPAYEQSRKPQTRSSNSTSDKLPLNLSFIGMSNVGKSYWSEKLASLNYSDEQKTFTQFSCDDLIEAKIKPELDALGFQGIADMAKWMGHPHEDRFAAAEARYLELESQVLSEVLSFSKPSKDSSKGAIIDTTGSVIYLPENQLKQLKENSLVVYLKSPLDQIQNMIQQFFEHPKPIVWGDAFNKSTDQNNTQALQVSYPKLLEYRLKEYEKLADVTLEYHEVRECESAEQLLQLIQGKLRIKTPA